MKNKILVTQSSMPSLEEYEKEISKIWKNKWLTNAGPIHNDLQIKLQEYLGINAIELFTNGHLALMTALKALKLKGEVITTPFTFASTTNAIVDCGLKPVFCDINIKNFTIDVDKIEALITPKTVAIMPVHVYGCVCDVEKIENIAKKHNLKVIYDAAHCFGVKYKNRGIASFGDLTMFSFHATKVFNTIEGGAVSVNCGESVQNRIQCLRNFGLNGEQVEQCGLNAKMNEFQASMGVCNLRHIQDEIAKRKNVSDMYDKLLSGVKGIRFLEFDDSIKRNYAYYPILIDENKYGHNRDFIVEKLKEDNIFARKYFYPITNLFNAYKRYYKKYPTPIAKEVSENVLCLPMYADLSQDDIKRICDIIVDNQI